MTRRIAGRTRRRPASSLVVWGVLGLAGAAPLAAQDAEPWARVTAQGVLAATGAEPVPGDRYLSELRVVQPIVMLHAGWGAHLTGLATLDLEGLTIPQGELALGDWGEGFMDRRHPHTYAHELLLTGADLLGRHDGAGEVSLTAGKGFAPFGTDDPMTRPPLRYPVNHHFAQILERAVLIGAARQGPVILELGLFNGDEPERPDQWPLIAGRFGDSWSGRITALPRAGLELQSSYAHVHSPEHREGAGPDQDKVSLSARWEGPVATHPVYGLVEWARTSEAGGFFVFHSLLAEGAWTAGRHRLYYRFERTERPEEERISDFRSLRPQVENSILGITRWTVHTAGYAVQGLALGPVRLEPLTEVSLGAVDLLRGAFEVESFYGDDHWWSWTLGIRIAGGAPMHRMGRYGAAAPSGEADHQHHGMGS
ncbi:MAG TPA: hypothetical protein VJQ44_05590 [Gemmatimonadales bacterium]|nr:hypothetical protein [Gemmatimonadales bacterium]